MSAAVRRKVSEYSRLCKKSRLARRRNSQTARVRLDTSGRALTILGEQWNGWQMTRETMKLGALIRNLRRTEGLTVRQLASEVGRTPGYISRVETRGEIPSPELICRLADALGAAPGQLLNFAESDVVGRKKRDIQEKHKTALKLYRRTK